MDFAHVGSFIKKSSPGVFLWPAPPSLYAHSALAPAPHLGAISRLNVRLLYTPTHNAWGLAGKNPGRVLIQSPTGVCVCVKDHILVPLWFIYFTCKLYCTQEYYYCFDQWPLSMTVFLFLPPLRRNILQMGLRWATAPSTSNTGWMGASLQWGWSTSCLTVYLLSTCITTQTLPHCLWAPTLLSGWLTAPNLKEKNLLLLYFPHICPPLNLLSPWLLIFSSSSQILSS